MASALHQLIAQQQGPNILGSAMQGLMASDQKKQSDQQLALGQQQVTLGQRQLANADAQAAKAAEAEGLKIMANAAVQIEQLPPEQRAAAYESIRSQVAPTWKGSQPWPEVFNDQVGSMLQFAKTQVYGDQMVKSDLDRQKAIEIEGIKARGKAPTIKTFNLPNGTQVDREFRDGKWVDVGAPAPRWSDRKGLSVTLPDGTVISEGMSGDITNKTRGAIEERKYNSVESLSRLSAIESEFRPEFLQLGPRWQAMATGWKEKVGAPVSEDDKKAVQEFSKFKRASISNVNRTIKEITGAAMGVQEAQRITAELPNPGQGLFDGDAPTAFKAKLDSAVKDTKRAIMRSNYALANNMDPLKTGIELADVDALVDSRGEEVEQVLRQQNPNAAQEMIDMQVRDQLAKEFGLE